MPHVPLRGSEPPFQPDVHAEAVPRTLMVRLSILLKDVAPAGADPARDRRTFLKEQRTDLENAQPRERKYLTPDQIARTYGPPQSGLNRLRGFLRDYDLHIEDKGIFPAHQHVVVSGQIANVERAFQVELLWHTVGGQKYLWHKGPVYVPAEMADVIEAVVGLYSPPLDTHSSSSPPASGPPGVDPRTMACAYDFPPGNASGQCIAIILLGGGYDRNDLDEYFKGLGLPTPSVTLVALGSQTNNPAPASRIAAMLGGAIPDAQTLWTLEASLDIELIGTLANDAHIVVYLAENTTQGKLEALARATSDPFDVSVISCSFGTFEDLVTQADLEALDDHCLTAGLCGITVCVSSGDKGDGSGGSGNPRVRFMASSPNVLGCGGTHATIDKKGTLTEVVWNEVFFGNPFSSGGGVSGFFPLPVWQANADVPNKTGGRNGRGVPDVSAKSDMLTGYPVVVRGFKFNMGGTSAAAPLWASLAARLNQNLGRRIGHVTPLLYTPRFATAFRDVTSGNNGLFSAHPSWDACTGLGSPKGKALLRALR